jgi:PAS domain S-box-containing protein
MKGLSLLHRVITYCAGILLLISITVLIGWQTDNTFFKSWLLSITPMNPMNAVVFVVIALWIFNRRQAAALHMQTAAAFVLIHGIIHFFTYLFDTDAIRYDYLLYENAIHRSGIRNWIAPNAALNFILIGVVMLFMHPEKFHKLRQFCLLLSFTLVYTSILGYLFNIAPAYQFAGLTPMAFITAAAFLLAVLALFLEDRNKGISKMLTSPGGGGLLMRRIVPFVLTVPPFLEYLRFRAESAGYFPGEFGVEMSSLLFTISLLILIGYHARILNIKEREEKENTLRYRTLMESLHEGVIEFDQDSVITYCNPSFERLFGYSKEKIVGKKALNVLVPQKNKEVFVQRLENRNAGVDEAYETELLTHAGERKQIAIHAKPLPDAHGNIKGTVVSLRDITQEKMHLQDLETFTASAAHDLSSPLSNIQLLMRNIDKDNLNADQRMMINMADETATHMRELVNELLLFYRMGAGQELVKTKLDTQKLVNEIVRSLGISENEILIDNLPSVTANEIALKQMLTNLLSNAVKYTAGAPKRCIHVGTRVINGKQWFYISDNGIGIPEKNLADLFTPFKRFTSKFEGNGLGLAIVKRIVDKHGGTIEASLNPTGGMRFDFTLETVT